MTGQTNNAFLRQLTSGGVAEQKTAPYVLPGTEEVVVGRDPSCQIVLNDSHGGVSRRHAVFRPLAPMPSSAVAPTWEICDLNSANGIFINGTRLQGCHRLQMGDRIALGDRGPEFIFEYPSKNTTELSPSPQVAVATLPQPDSLTFTQLFPIFSTGRDLTRKAFLIPGTITVIFVVLMFSTVGSGTSNFIGFSLLLAVYLAGGALYFVYQLCGKSKPWWVLLASTLATVLILMSPIFSLVEGFFNLIWQGQGSQCTQPGGGLPLGIVRCLLGAGFPEELLKALPVLGAYFIGRQLHSPWRESLGVWEPLDGILLGAASSVGFTLVETLLLYVPRIIQSAGPLVGLQLLIPRILGEVSGHMAYSGYFGYFIGLSVLKPRKRWSILVIGYLTAAVIHALWDATATSFGALALVIVGVLSYAFLMAAILKARALSPTRSQNFATRFIK
ncbi:MAG: PrsW family glutamic-type intramembrane protease [Chamaesiphon sp.]